MKNETIIWQSKIFPKMILTKEHLEVLKYAYPQIKQFEPELRKAEAWLFVHQERAPKKNWRAFINNWMKNTVEFRSDAVTNRQPNYGDAAKLTPKDPKILSEILGNLRPDEAEANHTNQTGKDADS